MTDSIIYFGSQLDLTQDEARIVANTAIIISVLCVLVGLFVNKWLKLEMPYGMAAACGATGFVIGFGVGITIVVLRGV
jgi:hypothetical protein